MKTKETIFLAIVTLILSCLLMSCKKETLGKPGEVNYCVTCTNEQNEKFDTCASLDVCNQWVKKHQPLTCYYKKQ